MAKAVSCPDRSQLQQFLLGKVSAAEADQIETHLASCSTCGQLLGVLYSPDAELEGVKPFAASKVPGTEQLVIDGIIRKVKQLKSPHAGPGQDASTPAFEHSGPSTEHAVDQTAAAQHVGAEITALLSPPQRDDEIGRLGPYRILKILGAGGMGVVFQAEDPALRRMVALKVMRPSLGRSEYYRRRFLREAHMMAALEHDHIAPIFQVGEDRDVLFLALPLLRGETLEDRIAKVKFLGWLEILRIGGEIAKGLSAAHDLGIIHRDIKPSNLWLEAGSDRVKVLDFGVAQPLGDQAKQERRSVAGTPAYMSPEQARLQPLDARSDLFSLGCVLYRLCTGTPAFENPDKVLLMMSVVADQPRPVREARPDCPPELAKLVTQLLAKDPKERPVSAAAVAQEAERIRRRILQAPLRRRLKAAAAIVLASLLVWAGIAYGPWLYLVAANQAVLSLDSADETATVLVKQDGRVIGELHPTKQLSIQVPTGQFDLEIAGDPDGLQLAAPVLLVGRGDEEKVIVRKVPLLRGQLLLDAGAEPLKISLHRGGKQVASLNLPAVGSIELPAGDYDVCLVDQPATLRAFPDRVTIEAGKKTNARISPVGELRRIDKPDAAVNSVAVDAQGKLVLAGISGPRGAVGLWSVKTGQELFYKMKEQNSPVAAVALSRDGKWGLAGGGVKGPQPDLGIRVWDVSKQAVVGQLEGSTRFITCVAFAKDPKVAFSGAGDRLTMWNLHEKKVIRAWLAHEGGIHCLAVLPDSNQMITGGAAENRKGEIHLWDLDKQRVIRSFSGHAETVRSVAVSADGTRLASASWDGAVRCWDIATAKEINSFSGHQGKVNCVALSPDGTRILSGGADGIVRLWDLELRAELLQLSGHKGTVNSVAFLPDGRHAVSGGNDQHIRVWKLP